MSNTSQKKESMQILGKVSFSSAATDLFMKCLRFKAEYGSEVW